MKKVSPVTLVALAAVALTVAGCSDDVVCPDIVPDETVPYVSALLTQSADGRAEFAYAEVVCSADPLPTLLITFINGRELSDVGLSEGMGLKATFEDDEVLWAPGESCSLEVTTDFGYATSAEEVPAPADVDAPLESIIGDTLTLSWNAASGADYYRITATLVPDLLVRGQRDTLEFEVNTRGTSVEFTSEDLPVLGQFSGIVESVAGPFPEGGTAGNIDGDAWGFFTTRYSDAGSVFDVIVYDPEDRTLPPK